ncbi:MAG TPA: prepilin-type N-terminal cleavage/methylation domain-containing protein [Solirubrobacteraceae bacterium]|nr:prepilin-type N-terminal cleavage/methylation domain-containing protein [Solirubrobacteraceae bacterium]
MITFSAPIRPSSPLLTRLRRGFRHGHDERALALRSQDGMTLIEVLISSVIVGIVTLGTFAGFDALGKSDADQRHHNQATVLAAQSQEALRSDPATALNELVNKGGHVYTQTVQGTKYTITQTAQFETGSGTAATCNAAAGHSNEASNYIRVSSSVRWSSLGKTRPAVTATSLITPPVGSALEVDVTNGGKVETAVPGVTVIAEGVETTTSEKGCVIYNGIPSTTTEVEAFKLGYVTKSGAFKFFAKEVSIAPNVITHESIYLAQGGSITANFKYNKGATAVTGDTFVAVNNEIGVNPETMAGATKLAFNSESAYTTVPGTYASSAKTAIEPTHYPTGNLFPQPSAWTVYAGDCASNNPEKYGVSLEKGGSTVTAGANTTTSVPMSLVTLNVYKNTKATPEGLFTTTSYPATVTNLSCTTPLAATPNDAYKANYEHPNSTSTTGHLTNAYQPFGKFKLCFSNGTKTFTSTYTNSTEAGSTVNVYLKASNGTVTEGSGPSLVETTVATGTTC